MQDDKITRAIHFYGGTLFIGIAVGLIAHSFADGGFAVTGSVGLSWLMRDAANGYK